MTELKFFSASKSWWLFSTSNVDRDVVYRQIEMQWSIGVAIVCLAVAAAAAAAAAAASLEFTFRWNLLCIKNATCSLGLSLSPLSHFHSLFFLSFSTSNYLTHIHSHSLSLSLNHSHKLLFSCSVFSRICLNLTSALMCFKSRSTPQLTILLHYFLKSLSLSFTHSSSLWTLSVISFSLSLTHSLSRSFTHFLIL